MQMKMIGNMQGDDRPVFKLPVKCDFLLPHQQVRAGDTLQCTSDPAEPNLFIDTIVMRETIDECSLMIWAIVINADGSHGTKMWLDATSFKHNKWWIIPKKKR